LIIGFVLQIFAVVFGIKTLNATKKGDKGRGIAITGLVLGIIGFLVGFVTVPLVIVGILGGIPSIA
jgi:hypothetical protein